MARIITHGLTHGWIDAREVKDLPALAAADLVAMRAGALRLSRACAPSDSTPRHWLRVRGNPAQVAARQSSSPPPAKGRGPMTVSRTSAPAVRRDSTFTCSESTVVAKPAAHRSHLDVHGPVVMQSETAGDEATLENLLLVMSRLPLSGGALQELSNQEVSYLAAQIRMSDARRP